jgi:hypothetical protein
MANKKSSKIKEHSKKKKKPLIPEVVSPNVKIPPAPTMDGTCPTDFSHVRNKDYSSEIIQEADKTFSLEKLLEEKKKGDKPFLAEGEKQIFKLWHSIEALTTHNTLFVVQFLYSIGEILNEIKSALKPHEFAKWRRKVFHYKHERYLQQAQQLAKMGIFAKQYASMGKNRLLALDHLRKAEDLDSCENLFETNPFPKEVTDEILSAEYFDEHSFPDSTEDIDGELLNEHVNAKITYHRLINAGINFATFDQAFLLAACNKNAIGIKAAQKISNWLELYKDTRNKKKWFNIFVMDKGKFPDKRKAKSKSGDSLNQLLAKIIDWYEKALFDNNDWVEKQKTVLDENFFFEGNKRLKAISRKFKISLSVKPSKTAKKAIKKIVEN